MSDSLIRHVGKLKVVMDKEIQNGRIKTVSNPRSDYEKECVIAKLNSEYSGKSAKSEFVGFAWADLREHDDGRIVKEGTVRIVPTQNTPNRFKALENQPEPPQSDISSYG